MDRHVYPFIAWRVVTALIVLSGMVMLSIMLFLYGPSSLPLRCFFHDLTGLHCPGCGMTRASFAMLHGEPLLALRNNFLGLLLLPPAIAFSLLGTWQWLQGKPLKPGRKLHPRFGILLVWIIVGFWILRNLPWVPFTFLAPL